MFKLFTALVLSACCTAAFAQIEEQQSAKWETIGELKTLGITKAKMQFVASGSDTTFLLLMKDMHRHEDTNYFSIKFNSTGNTFGKFYDLLKSFFIEENRKNRDYMRTVKLGSTMVNFQHNPLIGGPGVRITTNDGYVNLTQRDIDRLFGKR
jgi:hypothetical protein